MPDRDPDQNHVLLLTLIVGDPPHPTAAMEAVRFEVGYFVYLASLTAAVTGAVLAFLKADLTPGWWCKTALVSVLCFMLAIAFVTIGYDIRVHWILDQTVPRSPWVVRLDKYANSPYTALLEVRSIKLRELDSEPLKHLPPKTLARLLKRYQELLPDGQAA